MVDRILNMTLSNENRALVHEARKIIEKRFKPNWHLVGSALRTRSGKIFSAVHLEAHVGRIAVCAEAVTLGMAAAAGDTEIDTIVAVDHLGNIVSPCGMCRELISDYSPNAWVIVPGNNGEEVIMIEKLLPNKYARKEET